MSFDRSKRQRDDSPFGHRKRPASFLGRPLNKLDIDELTDIIPTRDTAEDRRAALRLAIPTSKKSLKVWDQIAVDDRGRRRFHGAFTGGFSAGYFNTVDTVEGWKPQQFQSSRKERYKVENQRVEDFMDSEDYENVTSGPSSIPISTKNTATDEFEVFLNHTQMVGLGATILRRMGWREGTPVFSAMLRRVPLTRENKLRPQLPNMLIDQQKQEKTCHMSECGHEEEWLERRRIRFEKLIASLSMFGTIKTNLYGLGFSDDMSLRRPIERKKRSPGGFGMGVLEEEEEYDVYDDRDHGNDSMTTTMVVPGDETEEKFLRKNEEEEVRFVSEKQQELNTNGSQREWIRCYHIDCKDVPIQFSSRHLPSAPENKELSVLRGAEGHCGVLSQLVKYLAEKNRLPNRTSNSSAINRRRDLLKTSSEISSEAASLTLAETQSSSTSRDRPLWSALANDAKKALIASLSSTTKFISESTSTSPAHDNLNYPNDPEKQKRYELFCLALEEKIPVSAAFEVPKSMSEEMASTERLEFGNAYRNFRLRHPNGPITPVSTNELYGSHRQVMPRYTRQSFNWKPERLLCRRFHLRDPWEGKTFIHDYSASEHHLKSGNQPTSIRSTREFVSNVVNILGDQDQRSTKSNSVTVQNVDNVTPSTTEVITDRAPLSIFKSVFGGDEDEND